MNLKLPEELNQILSFAREEAMFGKLHHNRRPYIFGNNPSQG